MRDRVIYGKFQKKNSKSINTPDQSMKGQSTTKQARSDTLLRKRNNIVNLQARRFQQPSNRRSPRILWHREFQYWQYSFIKHSKLDSTIESQRSIKLKYTFISASKPTQTGRQPQLHFNEQVVLYCLTLSYCLYIHIIIYTHYCICIVIFIYIYITAFIHYCICIVIIIHIDIIVLIYYRILSPLCSRKGKETDHATPSQIVQTRRTNVECQKLSERRPVTRQRGNPERVSFYLLTLSV